MADIVLKDRNGNDVQYPGVNYLKVNTVDGGTQGFAAYDPETLKAENLPVGVNVGDVVGALEIPEQVTTTIDLDFANGDMEVTPEDGQAFSKVTIPPPANLVPGNIAKDVDIAGVVGTLETGGGGSEVRIDYTTDESGNIIGATPYGFAVLPVHAFRNLATLEWVDLSNCPNLTTISDYAFLSCSALTGITIPDSVTTIGVSAFAGCTSITSITIPDSVITINNYAFSTCSALASITIGSGVTRIGTYSFNACGNLTSVTFKDTTTWYRTKTPETTSTYVTTQVTNASTAATYLSSTYKDYYFVKL